MREVTFTGAVDSRRRSSSKSRVLRLLQKTRDVAW